MTDTHGTGVRGPTDEHGIRSQRPTAVAVHRQRTTAVLASEGSASAGPEEVGRDENDL